MSFPVVFPMGSVRAVWNVDVYLIGLLMLLYYGSEFLPVIGCIATWADSSGGEWRAVVGSGG